MKVLCSVSTKDRYDILPMCISSILLQTRKPDKLIIFDDGEQKDLRSVPIFNHLFRTALEMGIELFVAYGARKGQHFNHQTANTSGFDFVWRVDDDEVPEPDVLEKLLSYIKDDVGAVGGAVYTPGQIAQGGTNKLVDIYSTPNLQWNPGHIVTQVDHLYSSFLYRAGIVNYNLDLSPVAHREETLFTHELKRAGYKLIVDTSIKTYHYRFDTGGIRAHNNAFFYEHDERIFKKKMEEFGYKLININNGIGDHYAFLNIVPKLQEKYGHLILGCVYPEVFKDLKNVTLIPISASEKYSDDNIYKFMIDNNWKESIVKAYAKMLGVN